MKPLHASITRLSRCSCCQSQYSKKNSGNKNKNHGKTAARMKSRREIQKELRQ